jgi:hypothetical protein
MPLEGVEVPHGRRPRDGGHEADVCERVLADIAAA